MILTFDSTQTFQTIGLGLALMVYGNETEPDTAEPLSFLCWHAGEVMLHGMKAGGAFKHGIQAGEAMRHGIQAGERTC